MSYSGYELTFTDTFLDDLIDLENYIGRENPKKGRMFTSRIYDYIIGLIKRSPFAYPMFIMNNELIRRGVFEKNYIIVYEVKENNIELLRIYHTSRNPDNLRVD
jgi:plasmid stabilization system protein ParE